MDGSCDVPGCTQPTFMGWQLLTESRGRQICEHHWNRHKDPADPFNLWDVFGFRKPAGMQKPAPMKDVPEPAAEPEPLREKPEPRGCRACGGQRERGYTYCRSCARERKKQADRERQRRQYRKKQDSHAFVPI